MKTSRENLRVPKQGLETPDRLRERDPNKPNTPWRHPIAWFGDDRLAQHTAWGWARRRKDLESLEYPVNHTCQHCRLKKTINSIFETCQTRFGVDTVLVVLCRDKRGCELRAAFY